MPSPLDVERLDRRLVVTVCDLAHEDLATLPGSSERIDAPVLHWSIPDPAASGAQAAFDDVVHTLERRVRTLVPSVTPI